MNGKSQLITVSECALHHSKETPESYLDIFGKTLVKPMQSGSLH